MTHYYIKMCFLSVISGNSPQNIPVDLNAASQTFDQLLTIPWIKNSVKIKPYICMYMYITRERDKQILYFTFT